MLWQYSMSPRSCCILIVVVVSALQISPATSRILSVTTAPEATANWIADAIRGEAIRAASAPAATRDAIAQAAANMANKLAAPGPATAPAPAPAPAPAAVKVQSTTEPPAPAPAPGPASAPALNPAPAPAPAPSPAPAGSPAAGFFAPTTTPITTTTLPAAPPDFVIPTLRPDHGLSIPEMAQMAVHNAVAAAEKESVAIGTKQAHLMGLSAGHRLGNVLARTAAEAATKATSHELITKACRIAAVDGMDAVHEASKHLGLTEDEVMVARQEVAVGGFQRKCEQRVKNLMPVEWAEHHALHAAEMQTRAFINNEGSRRAAFAGEKAALSAVAHTATDMKLRLGRLAAWEAEHQLMLKQAEAERAIRKVAATHTLQAALKTATEYPKVMFQKELMDITTHVSPQLVSLLDRVAMKAVMETVEETALKTVVPATKRLAKQVIASSEQRQLFDGAMGAVGITAHSKALAAAQATALAVAHDLTDPQAFDLLTEAGLGRQPYIGQA